MRSYGSSPRTLEDRIRPGGSFTVGSAESKVDSHSLQSKAGKVERVALRFNRIAGTINQVEPCTHTRIGGTSPFETRGSVPLPSAQSSRLKLPPPIADLVPVLALALALALGEPKFRLVLVLSFG